MRMNFVRSWKENYNGDLLGMALNKAAGKAWTESDMRAKVPCSDIGIHLDGK
jgi:hypothetical protein